MTCISNHKKGPNGEVSDYMAEYMDIPSISGLFGVPRCHETAGNKYKQGEKDREIDKAESENTTKTAMILWRFFVAIFTIELVFF